MRKKGNLVFWDLGCGAGKVLVAAAISEKFSEIYGVEFLEELSNGANTACHQFMKLAEENKMIKPDKMNVTKGDILKVDWSNADIIYIASVCYPEPLMEGIIEKTKFLKKGTIIITLKLMTEMSLKAIQHFKIKMTWGSSDIYILEKT